MSLIGRFEHLPNRPKSDEARPLLEKIASQVKPIMAKRGWKVGTLAEFLPADPSLLGNNMNAGERINLRLRPPGSPSSFYEYDQLVLVMLHELTHIEHGPHDAKFYKLLGELEEEYYDLKRKGYSGEGFHGAGNHLSGFKVPEYQGKAKGLAAAQKRLETQKKMGKGGVLGGTGVLGRSMKEVLAEAAERRIRDDRACHPQDAGHAKEVEEEVRKAQAESVGIDVIDLTGEDGQVDVTTTVDEKPVRSIPPDYPQPTAVIPSEPTPPIQPVNTSSAPKRAKAKPPEQKAYSTPLAPSIARSSLKPAVGPTTTLPSGEWACPTCTLLNEPLSLSCDACATLKPSQKGAGATDVWYCGFCGAGPREMGYWSCIECGWVRKWG